MFLVRLLIVFFILKICVGFMVSVVNVVLCDRLWLIVLLVCCVVSWMLCVFMLIVMVMLVLCNCVVLVNVVFIWLNLLGRLNFGLIMIGIFVLVSLLVIC